MYMGFQVDKEKNGMKSNLSKLVKLNNKDGRNKIKCISYCIECLD